MDRQVAFVTGASRGIGKACAIELASAGFDIAITARTVQSGESREHSSTLRTSDTSPLPGSLNETAGLIREVGAEVLVVPADLLDFLSLGVAVATVLERLGRIDVVVHNGRYVGPGHMDRFMDTPLELINKQIQGNLIAPLAINQLVIPGMIERGGGTIINMSSVAGYADPTKRAGEGGWGLGYGMTKAAFHRVAGFIALEHGHQGLRCFNVQPGAITTERKIQDYAKFGITSNGAPPEVVGKVVTWLATEAEAAEMNGTNIEAQFFCHERGLLPGWSGPVLTDDSLRYDRSGAILAELEAAVLKR